MTKSFIRPSNALVSSSWTFLRDKNKLKPFSSKLEKFNIATKYVRGRLFDSVKDGNTAREQGKGKQDQTLMSTSLQEHNLQ